MRVLLICGMEGISGAQRGAECSPPTSALRVAECREIWEGRIVPSCGGLLREPQSDGEMEGGSSAQPGAECSPPSASVEPAKSISGRRIDFLDYAIDVDQQLVVIAKKNVLKALHAYFRRL